MPKPADTLVKCRGCGEEFDWKEEGAFHRGNHYCHECWHDHEFHCILCDDRDTKEDEDGLPIHGTFLAVFRAKECGLKRRGIYEIKEWPYYSDGSGIEMSLFEWRVKRVRALPDDCGPKEYAAGGLCEDCMTKLGLDRKATGAYLQQKGFQEHEQA